MKEKAKILFDASLTGYAAILFSDRKRLGGLLLLATLFHWQAGLLGFLGALVSNAIALYFGANEDKIRKGLYAFNGLLVGLSFSLFNEISPALLTFLLLSLVLLFFTTLGLDHLFGYFLGLPVLSLPFVFVSIACYFAFFNYSSFQVKQTPVFFADDLFPKEPHLLLLYLKGLGGIFFQKSPWAGLVVALALFLFSRIAFLLSLGGFFAGLALHFLLGGSIRGLDAGMIGFNAILTSIAVGGIFLVPSPRSFALGIAASLLSVLVTSFIKIFFINFSIPVMALPFCTVSLLVLFGVRLLHNPLLKPIDFLPGSPEKNTDYYKTRLERFGQAGIEIRLPFSGKWKISQGYDGEFTHTGLWSESLDFMAVDEDGNLRRGLTNEVSDYYTYGLPVLAVADGTVVKVVNHVPDNLLGEMDIKNNWGNLVLLYHGPGLYSHVSHLKPDSIIVKEGDRVVAGEKLGLAGNSGRSPEPHLHLHFQSTPEIGSPTRKVGFSQFIKYNGTRTILFSEIPNEGDTVSNLESDFGLSSFFRIAPGNTFSLVHAEGETSKEERWEVGIDFLGSRYIENEEGDRLYYLLSEDYFAGLSYHGSRTSALFYFFVAAYRIPLDKGDLELHDPISYRYFSSFVTQIYRGLFLPFTDRMLWNWTAKTSHEEIGVKVESAVANFSGKATQMRASLELSGSFPGHLRIQKGERSCTIKPLQSLS